MKQIQIVAPGHILGIWETVWPMLNVAFINYEHGDYDIEQLKVLLIKEFQILFVVVEDNKILNELNNLILAVEKGLDEFDFQNTGELIYQFIWGRVADEYIEHVKTREDKEIALSVLDKVFKDCLKLIHPYMPFVTEAIWKELPKSANDCDLIALSNWPS